MGAGLWAERRVREVGRIVGQSAERAARIYRRLLRMCQEWQARGAGIGAQLLGRASEWGLRNMGANLGYQEAGSEFSLVVFELRTRPWLVRMMARNAGTQL